MNAQARWLPLTIAAGLLAPACGGEEPTEPATQTATQTPTATQATATPSTPTPSTPTATPATPTQSASTPTPETPTPATPTQIPGPTYDFGYRTSSWVMDGSTGLDLNGDTTIDNQFVPVYELSIEVISNSVYVGVRVFLLQNGVSSEQAEFIARDVQSSFDEFMTIENFNVLLAGAIEDERLNFAEALVGEPSGLSLDWYSAVKVGEATWGLRTALGAQSGTTSVGATSLRLGPGDLTYDFSSIYEGPLASKVLMLSGEAVLVVSQSYSAFNFTPEALTNGDIGGLVSQDAMLNFMRGLVPVGFCPPGGGECNTFDILAETLDTLESVYTDPSNAGLWTFTLNGQPAAPVGFGWAAGQAELIDQVGDGGIDGPGAGNP